MNNPELLELEISDVDLVRLLKIRDEQSLNRLWEALYRDSQKIARRYRQPEDLGYDAAVRAYEKLSRNGIQNFQFRSSFRSYCWTIIAREMLRLMKRAPEFELKDLEIETMVSPPKAEPHAPADIIFARIRECLDGLKGNRRRVFELVDLEQKSPTEVAEILGLSRNNVSKLASRARLDMRRCLQSRGYQTLHDVLSP